MQAKLKELIDDLRRSQSAYDREGAYHFDRVNAAKCQGKAQAFGEAADRIKKILEEE